MSNNEVEPQPRERDIYHVVSTGIYGRGWPFSVEVFRLPLTEHPHHHHQATTQLNKVRDLKKRLKEHERELAD